MVVSVIDSTSCQPDNSALMDVPLFLQGALIGPRRLDQLAFSVFADRWRRVAYTDYCPVWELLWPTQFMERSQPLV
jgi:hypothetical protein